MLLPSWFPGGGFKREAATWRPIVEEMYMRPYREVKAALVRDSYCFVHGAVAYLRTLLAGKRHTETLSYYRYVSRPVEQRRTV